jgi:hypothetical protein
MGFWDAYVASLKPAEVEEPIDRALHRPLGYIVAKLSMPTPISADLITLGSIFIGLGAAAAIVVEFPFHMQVGGLLIFLSAVFDCADGQLARMRRASSAFGRMLDGCADLIVSCAVAPATVWFLWRRWHSPVWLGVTIVALAVITIVTSSFHTSMYDHYKNVWLRFTSPGFKEGEDHATAAARYESSRGTNPLWREIAWRIYLFYVKGQEDFVKGFDPFTVPAIGGLPQHTAENEAIYRRHAGRPFALLRRYFGFGSMIFGLALFDALEVPEIYLAARLIVLNAIFFLHIRPMQRGASREALAEMEALGGWTRPVEKATG